MIWVMRFLQNGFASFVPGEDRTGDDGQGGGLAPDLDVHDQHICPPVESAQRLEQETHRLAFAQRAGVSPGAARLDLIDHQLAGQPKIQRRAY